MRVKKVSLKNVLETRNAILRVLSSCCDVFLFHYYSPDIGALYKNLAITNRSRVSCINTNNNTMTLKSGLEVIKVIENGTI